MSRRCDLVANLGVQTGNNVSHSHRKTRRRFLPNLQNVSLISDYLKKSFNLRVAAATLRSVEHNGGLDNFLTSTSDSKLTEEAQKIKKQIKKVTSSNKDGKQEKAAPKSWQKKDSGKRAKVSAKAKKKKAA